MEDHVAGTGFDRPLDQQTNSAPQGGIPPRSVSDRAGESAAGGGKTTIEQTVVAKIVDLAAREVTGVHDLTPTTTRAALSGFASGLTSRVTGGDQRGQTVNVVVGDVEAAVDLGMSVDYGVSIPQVADAVRRNIIGQVAAMTGLTVKEVNIDVSDLYFPQAEGQLQARVQ